MGEKPLGENPTDPEICVRIDHLFYELHRLGYEIKQLKENGLGYDGVCKNTQKLPEPHKTKEACDAAAGNCEWRNIQLEYKNVVKEIEQLMASPEPEKSDKSTAGAAGSEPTSWELKQM